MATLSQVTQGVNDYFAESSEGAPASAIVTLAANSAVNAINEIRGYASDEDPFDVLEDKYLYTAVRIGIYLCEKQGMGSATSVSENGISRVFETGDIPPSLLGQVTPVCRGW